jgi:ATP-dependent DNA ligase
VAQEAQNALGAIYAVRYQGGGSDKVWAGAVAHSGEQALFVSCWGRTGANLQSKVALLASTAARAQLDKKLAEKTAEGYCPIDAVSFGIAETLRALDPACATLGALGAGGAGSDSAEGAAPAALASSGVGAHARVIVSHLTAASDEDLAAALRDEDVTGLSEKANGARLVLERTAEGELRAYNRRGIRSASIPEGALALAAASMPFLIDGERMEAELAGMFVMFDILERDGVDLRERPYRERIALLERLVAEHGAIDGVEPLVGPALAGRGRPGALALLTPAVTPAEKEATVRAVRASGGEGLVIRHLNGPSLAGDTRYERKIKYCREIDAVALGIKPGVGAGSVRYGVLRPSDGAWIELGTVRSGLRDADVMALAVALERAEAGAAPRPVLTVSFLAARTVGMAPVEPRVARLRDDKLEEDCGAEQLIEALGADRAPHIESARPFAAR